MVTLTRSWQHKSTRLWREHLEGRLQPRNLLILLIIGGTTAIISVAALSSYLFVRKLTLENSQENALLQVQKGKDEIDKWLAIRKTEVETIASSSIVSSADWSEVEPELKLQAERLKDNFYMLTMTKTDGWAYTTKDAKVYIGDRPHFKQAIAGKFYVSDPIISRTTGLLQMVLATPILPSTAELQQPIGTLQGHVKIERVSQIVDKLQYGNGSYAFALNSEGVAIVHPDTSLIGTPEKPAPSFLAAEDAYLRNVAKRMTDNLINIELVEIDGEWVYVAYSPLEEADWSIALVIPRENIEQELRSLNFLAVVVGGLLTVAMAGGLFQLSSYEKTRVRAEKEALLNRSIERILASLNLEKILETTVEEIAKLLHLERATFAFYDSSNNSLDIQKEYHRLGLESRTGLFLLSPEFADNFKEGKEVRLNPVDSSLDSWNLQKDKYLALSVQTQSELLGYLICTHANRTFDRKEELELLQAVADRLAIAITQSYLYNQLQDRVTLLDAAFRELKTTQTHLVQSEKMSSLGQMVAGVAHEINNPVNFIYANLAYVSEYAESLLNLIGLYEEKYPEPVPEIAEEIEEMELEYIKEDLPNILQSIKIGAERIRNIVVSLRNFSRLDEAQRKEVDIHQGIDSTILLLQHRFTDTISVEKQYGKLPLIECYASQLNQVFMSLISNALDAAMGRENKDAWIAIKTEVFSGKKGEMVRIAIADNGPGIPENIQNKIFDPFFTTKPVGKGTGLGLAIAYQIVAEVHGGQIYVKNSTPEGAELAIEIPIKSR